MDITITGARENNLKHINVRLPRNQFIVITGVSGSGKSSLAFDTIFAEAQRQYVESLSSFARRYLKKTHSPEVDSINGLSPAILINQRPLGQSPRSTVGTVTELYTLLRLLFSRVGTPHLSAGAFSFNTPAGACEKCKGLGIELAVDVDTLLDRKLSLNQGAIQHRTFKVGGRYWNIIVATDMFDMDKPIERFSKEELDLLLYSPPVVYKNNEPGFVQRFSYEGLGSRLLKRQSDNRGLEIREEDSVYLKQSTCTLCHGSRLSQAALAVRLDGRSIIDYSTIPASDLVMLLNDADNPVATPIMTSMRQGLSALIDLGIGYLTLNRSVDTLSGGESQRIKLARQLGNSLTEMLYILDEPTSGLHARDTDRLIDILLKIRAKPNTVIVVEHDETVMQHADFLVELGPEAGLYGGEMIASGTPAAIMSDSRSKTGAYLSGRRAITLKTTRRTPTKYIKLRHINQNNLQNFNVDIPTDVLTCITGVSGSGKSSLIEALVKRHGSIIVVDQSSIGKSPRSTPTTYVGAFDLIRSEFAEAVDQSAALFSFNGKGACPVCKGLGFEEVDMHFLDDVRLVCDECKGQRYNEEALAYRYQGKTIAEVLDMTIAEAISFFRTQTLRSQLQTLAAVGLDYLKLGQPSDTLSGGESQRVKMCSYLNKRGHFYVLDEPTRGLHTADVARLLRVLEQLVEAENSVLVVEHNLDIIKNADWIIDLGPEGGAAGGQIVVEGTPEMVIESTRSHTAHYLRQKIQAEVGKYV